jgi:hypothetical protein
MECGAGGLNFSRVFAAMNGHAPLLYEIAETLPLSGSRFTRNKLTVGRVVRCYCECRIRRGFANFGAEAL